MTDPEVLREGQVPGDLVLELGTDGFAHAQRILHHVYGRHPGQSLYVLG